MDFICDQLFSRGPWQAMERAVARMMMHGNYQDVRLIGRTGDGGADIIASMNGKRCVVQVKHWANSVGSDVVDEVLKAKARYRADIPIIATNRVFNEGVYKMREELFASGIPLQLWDGVKLKKDFQSLPENSSRLKDPRDYQKTPIKNIVDCYLSGTERAGIVIMATGLGKTFVAAAAVRELLVNAAEKTKRILVLAHTNELIYQLERSFYPFLKKNHSTAIWNGYEKGDLSSSTITFACVDSVASELRNSGELPVNYDMVIIDEAHHAGSPTYKNIIAKSNAATANGPFLLGMTATPWRSDEVDVERLFDQRLCCIDMVQGMANGYLANVDYRMHMDNIDWENLNKIHAVTPRAMNRTLFIREWDDAVIDVLRKTWSEVDKPRVIIFCSVIEHAITIRDKINALGFTRAEAIYSGVYNGRRMSPIERSITLCDFSDGLIGAMCAVDIFNEGIDVPDVNILVFQRVTHSRRIFVQQLGRGLRISPGKEKVIVLDFVSDIRRFAAGLELKAKLAQSPLHLNLPNAVRFVNKSGEDPSAESFLKRWLTDVAAIQDAGEDDHVLRFPDFLPER